MKNRNSARQSLLAASVVLMLCAGASLAAAQMETVIHVFHEGSKDGGAPFAGVIADSAGNLYGTASVDGLYGRGIVYELSPSGGSWMETVIWPFTGDADGADPDSNLIMDSSGALYGVTTGGGNSGCGTFFQLIPPSGDGGAWTENTLYSFEYTANCSAGNIIRDPTTGAFYGVVVSGGALGGGYVYELAPATGGTWTFTTLHAFNKNPNANGCAPWSLALASSGVLYGAAGACGQGGGVDFKLVPPGSGETNWRYSVIYSFGATSSSLNGYNPYGLVIGKGGVLYGTTALGGTSAYGTVYSLTPPSGSGGAWTETIIHDFAGAPDGNFPVSGVIFGPAGSFYGSTGGGGLSDDTCGIYPGCGTVFKLTPGSGGSWTESILHDFQTSGDAINPNPGPLLLRAGTLYGASYEGGKYDDGTVYAVIP